MSDQSKYEYVNKRQLLVVVGYTDWNTDRAKRRFLETFSKNHMLHVDCWYKRGTVNLKLSQIRSGLVFFKNFLITEIRILLISFITDCVGHPRNEFLR